MLPTCANKCFSHLLLFSGAAFVALPTLLCHGQIKFVVVGDTQGTGANVASIVPQLVSDINDRSPDFVLFPGDLVGTGTTTSLADWNTTTGVFGNNRFMVPGNHDLPGRPATNANWQSEFNWLPNSQSVPDVTTANPTDMISGVDKMDYYVDVAPNVRLISVTTDRDTLSGEPPTFPGYGIIGGEPPALDWFQSVMALDSTKNKEHVFVMTHHPVSSQMSPHPDGLVESTSTRWWQSIAGTDPNSEGATALSTGHIQAYYPNRPDPHSDTAEIVVGTGGGENEGVVHRQVHGFMEVKIDTSGNVTSTFFGDSNKATGGWSFTEQLDTFTISAAGGLPRGEQANYQFENGAFAELLGVPEPSSLSLLALGVLAIRWERGRNSLFRIRYPSTWTVGDHEGSQDDLVNARPWFTKRCKAHQEVV